MAQRIKTLFTNVSSNVSSYVSSGVETINNTPFVKDVKSGGILNGVVGGTERERLRLVVASLKSEHEMGAGIEYLLKKYDIFSNGFKRRDIVENWRNRLIRSTIGKSSDDYDDDDEADDEEQREETITLPKTCVSSKTEILDSGLTLYIAKMTDGKYFVGATDSITELRFQYIETGMSANIEQCGKVNSPFDELNKVYELMALYGVANVRGSRYQNQKLSLDEANELIKIITYLNGDTLVIDKKNMLDQTVIETYMLWRNGFTVQEIAEMKSLLSTTIQCQLDKSMKSGIRLQKENSDQNEQLVDLDGVEDDGETD